MPPRPQWSLKTSFLTALLLLAVITPLVFLVVHRTLWLELEVVTAVVAVLLLFYPFCLCRKKGFVLTSSCG